LVLAILNSTSPANAAYVFLLVVAFALFMFLVVKPLLERLIERTGSDGSVSQLMVVLTFFIVSVLACHSIV
jgi:predicted PurR-regulated permease PerM